jgi:hypothetical protein
VGISRANFAPDHNYKNGVSKAKLALTIIIKEGVLREWDLNW